MNKPDETISSPKMSSYYAQQVQALETGLQALQRLKLDGDLSPILFADYNDAHEFLEFCLTRRRKQLDAADKHGDFRKWLYGEEPQP